MPRLRSVAAAWLCAVSWGALAASDAEVAQLLGRVEFWQARQRDDLAREEIAKLLRLAPDHPEGLVLQARLQLKANQEREAAATLERLRKAHPNHPGVAQLAALLRIQGADKDRLRQARQLARAGRAEEAVKAYRAIFPGGFPDDELALEHAQAVAATPGGWEAGRALLAELARKHPADSRYAVAHVSHLSTRKPVSAETLKSLRELAAVPSVARQAKEAWRRALLAMDASEESLPALREYIAANPGETAVTERLAEVTRAVARGPKPAAAARAPRPVAAAEDARALARREGWAALEAGTLEQAEARLAAAIKLDSGDGEAAGGLGLVRLRQGRHDEAVELFTRAQARDAAGRSKWESLERTARYWGLLARARTARAAGELDRAAALVVEARSIDPKQPDGAMEAARVHVAAGRDREAEALLGEMAPDGRAAIGEAIAQMRASRLRDQARALREGGRDVEALPLLEQAATLDALDPWVRHDLARLYAARGERERGEALFAALLQRRPNDADTHYAHALFLAGSAQEEEALAALKAIAPGERTANMDRLERRLWVTIQGRRAAAFAGRGEREKAQAILAAMRQAAATDIEAALEVASVLDRMESDEELAATLDRIAGFGPATPGQGEAIAAMRRSIARRRDDPERERRAAEAIDQGQGWLSLAMDARSRAGTAGKSQLSAQELPLAYRSGASDGNRWFLRLTPSRVASGTLDLAGGYEVSTFGSMLLCPAAGCADTAARVEKGVALGAGLERGPWRFDLATSPIGFPVVNVLGGAQYKGELGPASYSVDVSRRPMMSSLLSYAGTRDPNTGRTWGGVVATGARLNLSRDSGGDYGAWGLAGLYRLTGRNVQDNDKAEAIAGLYRRLVNEPDRQLAVGVSGMLWHFSENAGEFTFGHGGYYSPLSYRSLALPVTYGFRTPDTSLTLRASVSVAWSRSRRAPFYPTDPDLQGRAEALASSSFVDPFYAGGNNGRSFGRSLSGAVEHQVAPSIFVGGRFEIERSTNYTPNGLLLYIRMTTDGPAARRVSLPPEPRLPGFQY